MSLNDQERYRKQAEDCRQMAAKAISPLEREADLAGDWLRDFAAIRRASVVVGCLHE
jgi:hypothetical protein